MTYMDYIISRFFHCCLIKLIPIVINIAEKTNFYLPQSLLFILINV